MKKFKRIFGVLLAFILMINFSVSLTGCSIENENEIVLRISNCEEYIDEGDWSEDDTVELSDGMQINSQNGIIQDYEKWFYEKYGKKVRVEYSTYGTNEELYNQLSIGDTYDLVCPSEYMIMKMMSENMLLPFSDAFYDKNNIDNYYINGVSPYIQGVFDGLELENRKISEYAAGYMWGTLGFVYDPEKVTAEEVSHWNVLKNTKFCKKITVKDSVRDAFFAANGILNEEMISSAQFVNAADYADRLAQVLNSTDSNTVDAAEEILCEIKENVYSFETDSGKSDMVTGKVLINQQWSGDAVYAIDQAEEDGVKLCYSVPQEVTNIWFDGWCMLKAGIGDNADKQLAAEAFVNYISRPDNAIRNMSYIGYTSVISGGDSDAIIDYINWSYAADDDEEKIIEYPIGYFFTGKDNSMLSDELSDKYTIKAPEDQANRQLYAAYPTKEVMERSVVMAYFNKEANERINQMWLDVRCFDLFKFIKKVFGK